MKLTADVHEGSTYREHQYLLTFTFTCKSNAEARQLISKINDTVSVINDKVMMWY